MKTIKQFNKINTTCYLEKYKHYMWVNGIEVLYNFMKKNNTSNVSLPDVFAGANPIYLHDTNKNTSFIKDMVSMVSHNYDNTIQENLCDYTSLIDCILLLGNNDYASFNPFMYIFEFSTGRVTYNVIDMYDRIYSSFFIDLSELDSYVEDSMPTLDGITFFFNENIINYINNHQIQEESKSDYIQYLVNEYNFKFKTETIQEQVFSKLL